MTATTKFRDVSLEDKYTLEKGPIYLSGTHALVRLPILQKQRDLARGLNTAGFISGYRGSPLGGYDRALWQAEEYLRQNDIVFVPGINEDLGATAVWGSQQVNLYKEAKFDGVFGIWYGKGPGVDRSGDALKHANINGTSRYGGVLAVAGDDHACRSSTLPHQSEYAFIHFQMPIISPAGVQDILDLGILGWELSRYCGSWVGFKTVAETVESSASVFVNPDRIQAKIPTDFDMPPGGLGIRWPDPAMEQEERHFYLKRDATLAFARANEIDMMIMGSDKPRLGIITTGKAYLDVRQALDDLGITPGRAKQLGIVLYKVSMPWPLEPEGIRKFAEGLKEVIVVEEKRPLIERQLKEQMYHWAADKRPRVVGKHDETGKRLLPSTGELAPAHVARVIGEQILRFSDSKLIKERVAFLTKREAQKDKAELIERIPYYCAGCPHNTSTVVPEGSRALAGIGCHYMATWMDRKTETYTQMGGEGVPWIGQAPFTSEDHIFANLGDGTYFHSGSLAIRALCAAKANITFKILYNDAVAMTGGQPVEGQLTVPQIARQCVSEGVAPENIIIMSDDPDKYGFGANIPVGSQILHRDELNATQKKMRQIKGVSVLIYDQTCAAEKRRRRKRGQMDDPDKRIVINEQVCEGCGDCSVQSNCLSIVPVETEYGRKRQIDQSTCNKDYSCVRGFCPSFVSVRGGQLKKAGGNGHAAFEEWDELPDPTPPKLDKPYGILVTGVGGTGIVTVGALLGMAAHIEGKGCSVLDQTGLAQKGGAVTSHVRIAKKPEDLHAVRIAAGGAKLVLALDMIVAGGSDSLSKMAPEETSAVINERVAMTADFTHDPDLVIPQDGLMGKIKRACRKDGVFGVKANDLALALMGDSIATNLFMMGYAYQKGLLPVSLEALMRAIELNKVAVDANKRAFEWGRRAAHDPQRVLELVESLKVSSDKPSHRRISDTPEEAEIRRMRELVRYQNDAYAAKYKGLLDSVRFVEERLGLNNDLSHTVARYAYKLMAYKDEYEVARLYTNGAFTRQLKEQFTDWKKLRFHLAPPLIARRDPDTGHLKKGNYGPWVLSVFRLVAKLKGLRETPFDIFGYTHERKLERKLRDDYFDMIIHQVLPSLSADNLDLAIEIASTPEHIRGFGHVKEAHVKQALAEQDRLLIEYANPPEQSKAA